MLWHLIPVISLEGDESQTDERRGQGVFANYAQNRVEMSQKQIFWGNSITLTSENYDIVRSEALARRRIEQGAKLFFAWSTDR